MQTSEYRAGSPAPTTRRQDAVGIQSLGDLVFRVTEVHELVEDPLNHGNLHRIAFDESHPLVLDAFALPRFERMQRLAFREELLAQAMHTFRRIRPQARLGLYTGEEKQPNADVLFASIQTPGRVRHLERFTPEALDYIVVDEFHHAAARTYRRLIDHFTPTFLLGLGG